MKRLLLILMISLAFSCQTKRPNDSNISSDSKRKEDSIRKKDSLLTERIKFIEESEKFDNYISSEKPKEEEITVINEDCGISISPDSLQIVELKGTTPEEQEAFYVVADDNSYYQVNAWNFLDSMKLKTIHPKTRYLKFEMKDDTILFDTKAKYSRGWMMLLFAKGRKPDIVDFVMIDSSYHKYMKK